MRFTARHHLKCILSLLAILMLMANGVSAESNPEQASSGTSIYKSNKAKKESNDFKASIALELKAISYAESSSVDSNSQQQLQVGLNLKKQGSFFTESNLIIGTFSEQNSVYYALPEAYIGFGNQNSNIVVGRKKENLSVADSIFNFGLLQSNFSNDNINFIEGGLTGIRGLYVSHGMGLMANFMPIFIPNQIPQTKFEDGKIVSSNRWAPSPPSKFKIGDDQKNINYAVQNYNLMDIISNSGFLLHAFIGQNKTRPIIMATYAKKPINEIALSRDTYHDISTAEGFVYLTPVVLTHEVQAVDLNLDYENINTTFSYIADKPNNVAAKNLDVMQNLSPLNIISFYASIDLAEVLRKKIKVYTALAVITGGEIRDLNSENKESSFSVANSRTLFKKPIRFGLSGETFFINKKSVEMDFKMTYDQELKGSLLSIQMGYSAAKNLEISLGADLIGTENELPINVQGNFLDQNKANDRFFAGINYVF